MFWIHFWSLLTTLLQTATGPRRRSLSWQHCLAGQITKSYYNFVMQGLHLLGTQNGKVYGTKR